MVNNGNDARMKEILLERGRLIQPPTSESKPTGIGTVRFYTDCENDCEMVLNRVKEVMKIINAQSDHWPSIEQWLIRLPDWFVQQCSPELTEADKEKLRQKWAEMSWEEKQNTPVDDNWRLSAFVEWFRPENREWFWWDAAVYNYEDGRQYIGVAVVVLGWPFPWGALKWLFKAAGAINLEPEEDI